MGNFIQENDKINMKNQKDIYEHYNIYFKKICCYVSKIPYRVHLSNACRTSFYLLKKD